MKRPFLFLSILLLALSSCSAPNPCDSPRDASCTKILFIGNSYIFVNDLPKTFAEMAEAGQHDLLVGSSAQGGWSLVMHAQSVDTIAVQTSREWDYVVLQEQSQIPSVSELRTRAMYPAARTLVKQIREAGAKPLFFQTWAHRSGWPEFGMNDYESMQVQIDDGYERIAQELHVPIVPVGQVWLAAIKQNPDLDLWQKDDSHPSEEGTYLAACVFYAEIFQESPIGLPYRAGLTEEVVTTLQTIASNTVLGIP